MKHRIKKACTHTPPHDPVTHTGGLHSSVGFPGYSLNKIVKNSKTTVILLLMLALTACQQKTVNNQPVQQAIKPVLVVHVNDYSTSITAIKYFDSSNAAALYNAVAGTSGTIKHVGIYAESTKQDVFTVNVAQIDTVNTSLMQNVYLTSKAKAKNQKTIAQFQERAKTDIARYIGKISTPATENNTDLAGAFQLAATTLEQANFSNHTKYLLVTSDLRDCPKKGQPRLLPMQLSNTTVLLIRPVIADTLTKQLFPACHVQVFTTTEDAITFISNNQNQ